MASFRRAPPPQSRVARAAVLDASGGEEVNSRAAPLFDSVGWVRGFEALLGGEAEGAAGR